MRSRSRSVVTTISLGVVIAPMLDIAFQVLAFVVMTYQPAALEGHLSGKLLSGGEAIQPSTLEAKVVVTAWHLDEGDFRRGDPEVIADVDAATFDVDLRRSKKESSNCAQKLSTSARSRSGRMGN